MQLTISDPSKLAEVVCHCLSLQSLRWWVPIQLQIPLHFWEGNKPKEKERKGRGYGCFQERERGNSWGERKRRHPRHVCIFLLLMQLSRQKEKQMFEENRSFFAFWSQVLFLVMKTGISRQKAPSWFLRVLALATWHLLLMPFQSTAAGLCRTEQCSSSKLM